jgi:hypothetical protein
MVSLIATMTDKVKRKLSQGRKRLPRRLIRRGAGFNFVGSDDAHSDISSLDGTKGLSYAQKFEIACQISLFAYQLKNSTDYVPRFLRTTACIRKA